MNILLLSPLPPPTGGIATWTQSLLNSPVINDINIEVVDTSKKIKVEIKRRNFYLEFIRFNRILREIDNNTKKKQFDLAHINTSCGTLGLIRDLCFVYKLKRKKIKIILQCHCDIGNFVNSKIGLNTFKLISKMVDKMLVLNSASKLFVELNCGINSEILPNFINHQDVFKDTREIKKRIESIVYTGRIDKKKGCDLIISAAKEFPNINFIMIGNPSSDISGYESLPNVKMLGVLDNKNVLKILREADLFLFPSLSEGFPISVLEAMAQGVPVIATEVGAIGDMLEESGGEIIEKNNINDLCEKIETLNNNALLRGQFSKWNVDKVKNQYTDTVVIKKLIELYHTIVDKHHSE